MNAKHLLLWLCVLFSTGCAMFPRGPTFESSVLKSMDDRQRIVINMPGDGMIQVGGRSATLDEVSTIPALPCFTSATGILLRAARDTPFPHVKRVMTALSNAGVDDFIFGAYVPENHTTTGSNATPVRPPMRPAGAVRP
jgi:hypothetical protein